MATEKVFNHESTKFSLSLPRLFLFIAISPCFCRYVAISVMYPGTVVYIYTEGCGIREIGGQEYEGREKLKVENSEDRERRRYTREKKRDEGRRNETRGGETR